MKDKWVTNINIMATDALAKTGPATLYNKPHRVKAFATFVKSESVCLTGEPGVGRDIQQIVEAVTQTHDTEGKNYQKYLRS